MGKFKKWKYHFTLLPETFAGVRSEHLKTHLKSNSCPEWWYWWWRSAHWQIHARWLNWCLWRQPADVQLEAENGWGCCFQSLRQPVKDSPHFPWQSKSMWLCAFAKVFACLSVCLKIMFNFLKNHSCLTICSTLYFLVCMLCMAWRKEKFCHTGWCSYWFSSFYTEMDSSFLSIRVSWPWHCWYSGQDRICCEKLSCAL